MNSVYVEAQDNWNFDLGELTLFEAPDLFNMERLSTVPYEFEDNV